MRRARVVGVAVVLAALALAGSGPARDRPPQSVRGPDFMLADAHGFAAFPLFYAGERVDGLPLVAVLRRADTADYVSFVYGECEPRDDAGCAPPVEIQVWPACRRHLGLYEHAGGASPPTSFEPAMMRGVPALWLDEGTRLELQSASSTVVVFAESRERAVRVARELRPLQDLRPTDRDLPAPLAGAVEGALRC